MLSAPAYLRVNSFSYEKGPLELRNRVRSRTSQLHKELPALPEVQTCSPMREISISWAHCKHLTEGSRLDIRG